MLALVVVRPALVEEDGGRVGADLVLVADAPLGGAVHRAEGDGAAHLDAGLRKEERDNRRFTCCFPRTSELKYWCCFRKGR